MGRTLVADVAKDVNGDTDVVGDEALVVEWHEGVEALEEREGASEEQGKVGEVRLKRLRMGQQGPATTCQATERTAL